jgi:ABC-type cobalamin transport system permease subunit
MAAFIGAFAVLFLVLSVSKRMADHQSLLIFGVMLGYFTSALITILQYKANAENIRAFVMWGMGSFSEVPLLTLLFMFILLIITWLLAQRHAMALNCYLLGDAHYYGARYSCFTLENYWDLWFTSWLGNCLLRPYSIHWFDRAHHGAHNSSHI